jgi:uncharacterized protein (TIGR01777 family)
VKVFVTGGSGFVGKALLPALVARGDSVVALSRSARPAEDKIEWLAGDPAANGAWTERAAGCDAICHLAGEPVGARRWTATQKQKILASRVDSAKLLAALDGPKVLVSASGVDFYPWDDSEKPYPEDAPAGDSYLGRVCIEWERAIAAAKGKKTSFVRTGLAVGKGSEALHKMTAPFKLFAGGPIGSGKQWLSWIHIDDLVGAYLLALDGKIEGPINGAAPETLHQKDFAHALGKELGHRSWLPVPAPAVRLAVGEFADYVLHGRRVVPAALEKAGYRFKHPDLAGALAASV